MQPATSRAGPQEPSLTGRRLAHGLGFHCDNGSFESMTLEDKKNQIHSLLPLVKLTDGPRKGVICIQVSRLPLVLTSFVPSRLKNNVPAFAIKAKPGGREVWVVLLKDIDKLLVMLSRLDDSSNPGIVMHGIASDPSFKSSVLQLLEHYAEYRDHHKVSLITHNTQ
ncbi:hypothetical protein BC831DRAFT_173580 [Entophlyctis helioformis]|nr:hypothetical protein BC831DRAFT_173580 [Entophlyctis helioformis]